MKRSLLLQTVRPSQTGHGRPSAPRRRATGRPSATFQRNGCPHSRMRAVWSAGKSAGIWEGEDRSRALFPCRYTRGGGGWETDLQGTREEAFVLPLWMSLRVELNCQLVRIPNHVLLSSLGPNRFVPPDSSRGQSHLPIPKGWRIPRTNSQDECRNLESGDPIIDIQAKPLPHSLLESAATQGDETGPGTEGWRELPKGLPFPLDRLQDPPHRLRCCLLACLGP